MNLPHRHRNSDHACDLPVHESVLIRTPHGRENCKIQAADPDVSIEWQEVERGFWAARCVCGVETYRKPAADDRVRLDPLDPTTARHMGECEFRFETEPTVLKLVLKATDREGYFWGDVFRLRRRLAVSALRRRVDGRPAACRLLRVEQREASVIVREDDMGGMRPRGQARSDASSRPAAPATGRPTRVRASVRASPGR